MMVVAYVGNSDWLIKMANTMSPFCGEETNGMCAWECIRIESTKTVLNKHNHILGRELLSPVKSPSESLEMDGVRQVERTEITVTQNVGRQEPRCHKRPVTS